MVWVDSQWVHDGTDWLEARATQPGLLSDLPVPWDTPPEGEERYGGIFSLVVDDPGKRTRTLPTMYHGNAQLYADRDVDKVRARLVRTIDAVMQSKERPAYLITACRIDGRTGLFARDVYNRAPFRMRVARAGLELAEDNYVRMTPSGEFEADGWEPFRPQFIVAKNLPGPRGREHENVNRGALLTFLFGILRVGDVGMKELHHLVSVIKTAELIDEEDPERLVDRLRASQR